MKTFQTIFWRFYLSMINKIMKLTTEALLLGYSIISFNDSFCNCYNKEREREINGPVHGPVLLSAKVHLIKAE